MIARARNGLLLFWEWDTIGIDGPGIGKGENKLLQTGILSLGNIVWSCVYIKFFSVVFGFGVFAK